ncbi:MAG: 4Fe-4S dicluster domain-containing protein [Bryobacteraceae bacterium]|nr:4Fe-4S dicluster domain-containing protein [Bryobacteraceae bacterium]
MILDRKSFLRLTGLSVLARKLVAAVTPKRWAMVVDARKCLQKEGCQKCIEACHRMHNVPAFAEPRHEVRWIWKEPFERAFPSQENLYSQAAFRDKPFPVFCNHCDNPPCVRVCPTGATWKRDDGIVMMDWHRCIGCRYCVAACPYGSRSFNWLDPRPRLTQMNAEFPTRTKGVVEKCTFCEERLARGEAPACVEACPEKAMVFGNLADPASEVRQLLGARYTVRRKPELGTRPEVYYIV